LKVRLKHALNPWRRLLLSAVALAGPVQLHGQQPASTRTFEAASIRISTSNQVGRLSAIPEAGRLVITAMVLQDVIQAAYGIQPFELVTIDSPVLKQRIDVVAKADAPVKSARELQQMLQPLLAERFKLAVHRETRELNALVLLRANKDGRLGPKMRKTEGACDTLGIGSNGFARGDVPTALCGILPTDGPGRIVARGIDMVTLAGLLAPSQRRPVLDQTGLQGRYDIDVTYTPEIFSAATLAQRGAPPSPLVDPDGPPLPTALQDQLGLKLEARRAPVAVVVIDHIEPLIEN
jgi:uncharacterized protein (TIGR03435 family)